MLYELFLECLNAEYLHTASDISYCVRRRGSTLHILFEASTGAADWYRNLDFPLKAYKRMGTTVWLAHRGFLAAWHELEPMLAEKIADKSVREIVLTGYSQGAAIALLCHEYAWFTRPDLRFHLNGFGFGCPRVIWGLPSASVRKRWERFTVVRNIGDAVTHLPPAWLGYTHVGKMLEIGAAGKYSGIDAHRPENILAQLKSYEKKHE